MKIQSKIAQDILNLIEKYDRIIVYRHQAPDYDALGSQFGLVRYLQANFPEKEILAPGFTNVVLAEGLYPDNDVISDETYKEKPFLAICLDTANRQRISDERFMLADKIIKIDHHPNRDSYGDINLVREEAGACSELIVTLLNKKEFKNYKITKEAAKFFFSAIVGDTGRFQYISTTANTFKIGAQLVKYGFNPNSDVYYPMYIKDMNDFEITKEVMNNYKISPNGVAYYHLDKETLERLHLDSDEAKAYLSIFSMHKGIYIWVCFAYDSREDEWRCSVRSRTIVINEVCAKHKGGGHVSASGCRPKTYEETLQIIEELDQEIIKQGKD